MWAGKAYNGEELIFWSNMLYSKRRFRYIKDGLIVYLYYATFDFNFESFAVFGSPVKTFAILTFLQFQLLVYYFCLLFLFEEEVKSAE